MFRQCSVSFFTLELAIPPYQSCFTFRLSILHNRALESERDYSTQRIHASAIKCKMKNEARHMRISETMRTYATKTHTCGISWVLLSLFTPALSVASQAPTDDGNQCSVILHNGCACAPELTRPSSPAVLTYEPSSCTGCGPWVRVLFTNCHTSGQITLRNILY